MRANTWRRGIGALAVVLYLGCAREGAQPDTPAPIAREAERAPPGTRADAWPVVQGGGTELFPRVNGTEELVRDLPPPHPPEAQVPLRSHRAEALDAGADGGQDAESPVDAP